MSKNTGQERCGAAVLTAGTQVLHVGCPLVTTPVVPSDGKRAWR